MKTDAIRVDSKRSYLVNHFEVAVTGRLVCLKVVRYLRFGFAAGVGFAA